jgi:hypothetical protein
MAGVELLLGILRCRSIRRRAAHPGALSKDNYNFYSWVYRAASYAALGRAAEAKAATSDALQHFPDLTIEGFTGTADNADSDRIRLIGPMRAAGFPPCAKPEVLAKNPQLVRLPECLSK